MDDQIPGQGGAGEAGEPKETPEMPVAPAPEVTETPSRDPLDDIKDPEARAEAKKFRAIARRKEGEAAAPAPAPAPTPSNDKVIEVLAQGMVSDEVKEHWDELMSIPLGGYDATDPRSVAANMTARLAVLKSKPKKDNPAKDLTTDAGVRGHAGPTPNPDAKPIPRMQDVDSLAASLYGKK